MTALLPKRIVEAIRNENLLARLKALVSKANRKGLEALDPALNCLIRIGMEIDQGRVTKSGYGVLELGWQEAHHRGWADAVAREVADIRAELESAHRRVCGI